MRVSDRFLLPDFLWDEKEYTLLVRPMPYVKMLALFRWSLQQDWMGGAQLSANRSRHYGLQSLKCRMLVNAKQLGMKEALRSHLGHHKPGSARQSVRLYSRDDVWLALDGVADLPERSFAWFGPLLQKLQRRDAVRPAHDIRLASH